MSSCSFCKLKLDNDSDVMLRLGKIFHHDCFLQLRRCPQCGKDTVIPQDPGSGDAPPPFHCYNCKQAVQPL